MAFFVFLDVSIFIETPEIATQEISMTIQELHQRVEIHPSNSPRQKQEMKVHNIKYPILILKILAVVWIFYAGKISYHTRFLESFDVDPFVLAVAAAPLSLVSIASISRMICL